MDETTFLPPALLHPVQSFISSTRITTSHVGRGQGSWHTGAVEFLSVTMVSHQRRPESPGSSISGEQVSGSTTATSSCVGVLQQADQTVERSLQCLEQLNLRPSLLYCSIDLKTTRSRERQRYGHVN